MADFERMALDERSDLRKELQFLKECQFKYFSLAVTISGLLIGIADTFNSQSSNDRGVLLAPLLVILPCWFIFFDKATTITRMVGYLTVFENIINGRGKTKFVGWENAILIYRDEVARVPFCKRFSAYWGDAWRGFVTLLAFRSSSRYWVVCWVSFFGLGAVSLWLGRSSPATALYSVSLGLYAIIAINTFFLLIHLVGGGYSYREARAKWEKYLSSPRAHGLAPDSNRGKEFRPAIEFPWSRST